MNVLLIFPFSALQSWNNNRDIRSIPLNVTYLAAAVRKAGFEVSVLDLEVERQKLGLQVPASFDDAAVIALTQILKEKLTSGNFDVVGIGCLYSGLFPTVTYLAECIKGFNTEIKVAIGGIHPTTYSQNILTHYKDTIDFIISGEGEKSFVELLTLLSRGEMDQLENIDGIGYWSGDGLICKTKTCYIDNLDELAFPATDLLGVKDYYTDTSMWHNPRNLPINMAVPILTSRSCPNGCNFCNMHLVHGKKIRYRSAANVVDEIKRYVNEYGLHYFSVIDDNLTLNKKRLIELMNLIVKENLKIQFSTDNGVFVGTLDEETMDALSLAGLVRLCLAFETGSDYIRNKVIGKGLTNKKISELAEIVTKSKYNHLYLFGFFVIGFPEETSQTLDETYRLMTSFPLDNYVVSYATPFPGTRLYDQCMQEKLFTKNYFYDIDSLVNAGAVYYESDSPHIQPYSLELSELIAFKKKALRYLDDKREHLQIAKSIPFRMGGNSDS